MPERIKEIKYKRQFLKKLSKLPKEVIERAGEKEKIFKENPFHPILKTHKLHGKEKEAWAFWIDYSYRIKFIFLSDNKVLFLDIGTHDVYE
ncbi:MAG: type II toxin-antitoxin system mRNA interferase toxin, RelE/StbE family [bacterium]